MDDFEEVPGNKPLRLPKKAAKVKNKVCHFREQIHFQFLI